MTNTEQIKLGFIEIVMFDDKSIRGGLLITDGDTYPYEFRVTTPIQATNMQRILYGAVYAEYVYEKLLGLPLLESVKQKPDLILARTKQLLDIRPYIECPMVLVKRSDNPKQESWTISLSVHDDFQSEQNWANSVLSPIIEQCDILEPFERLHLAIRETHKHRPEESR